MYRSKHNSPNVTRNVTLDNAAQNWANTLAYKYNYLQHEKPTRGYGENLYSYWTTGQLPNAQAMVEEVVTACYNEGKGYNYNQFNPTILNQVGHFTQLVWKSSTSIGVGIAIRDSNPAYIYFCVKYNPPGNVQSTEKYLANVTPPVG